MRGQSAALDETQAVAERLKESRYFGYARRLFAICRQHADAPKLPAARRLKLVQRHALCTYRDPDLPADRFAHAYSMLEAGDLNDSAVSQETLGLAGAIYKYRGGSRGFAPISSARSTSTGAAIFKASERISGTPEFNAAFVLDLLAAQETQNPGDDARRSGRGAADSGRDRHDVARAGGAEGSRVPADRMVVLRHGRRSVLRPREARRRALLVAGRAVARDGRLATGEHDAAAGGVGLRTGSEPVGGVRSAGARYGCWSATPGRHCGP